MITFLALAYVIVGLAAILSLCRQLAPQTPEERRAEDERQMESLRAWADEQAIRKADRRRARERRRAERAHRRQLRHADRVEPTGAPYEEQA